MGVRVEGGGRRSPEKPHPQIPTQRLTRNRGSLHQRHAGMVCVPSLGTSRSLLGTSRSLLRDLQVAFREGREKEERRKEERLRKRKRGLNTHPIRKRDTNLTCISLQDWVENHITCPILKRDTLKNMYLSTGLGRKSYNLSNPKGRFIFSVSLFRIGQKRIGSSHFGLSPLCCVLFLFFFRSFFLSVSSFSPSLPFSPSFVLFLSFGLSLLCFSFFSFPFLLPFFRSLPCFFSFFSLSFICVSFVCVFFFSPSFVFFSSLVCSSFLAPPFVFPSPLSFVCVSFVSSPQSPPHSRPLFFVQVGEDGPPGVLECKLRQRKDSEKEWRGDRTSRPETISALQKRIGTTARPVAWVPSVLQQMPWQFWGGRKSLASTVQPPPTRARPRSAAIPPFRSSQYGRAFTGI